MTWLDRFLQRWRRRVALRHVPEGSHILDIGTHDGELIRRAKGTGVGIDPKLARPAATKGGVQLVKGYFPRDLPPQEPESFEVATALAVVEHVSLEELQEWQATLSGLLKPAGRVVITVPAPAVDRILHVLMRLRLIGGMEVHQHYGFEPSDLNAIFEPATWVGLLHQRFQFGLNNLFVFERRTI